MLLVKLLRRDLRHSGRSLGVRRRCRCSSLTNNIGSAPNRLFRSLPPSTTTLSTADGQSQAAGATITPDGAANTISGEAAVPGKATPPTPVNTKPTTSSLSDHVTDCAVTPLRTTDPANTPAPGGCGDHQGTPASVAPGGALQVSPEVPGSGNRAGTSASDRSGSMATTPTTSASSLGPTGVPSAGVSARGQAIRADQRAYAVRPQPAHALPEAEHQAILEVAHSPEFASKPPNQIMPPLADREIYQAP